MSKSQSDKRAEFVEYVRSDDGEIPEKVATRLQEMAQSYDGPASKRAEPDFIDAEATAPFLRPALILLYLSLIALVVLQIIFSRIKGWPKLDHPVPSI